jgi:hypothetical protein
MITKKLTAFVALATCAFALSALGGAKPAIRNPLGSPVRSEVKLRGQAVYIIDLTDGTWESVDWGESDLFGQYQSFGRGTGYAAQGSVVSNFDDGDVFTTFPVRQAYTRSPGRQGYDLSITGGTGPYNGASGVLNHVSLTSKVIYSDATTVVLSVTYVNSGIITYYPYQP